MNGRFVKGQRAWNTGKKMPPMSQETRKKMGDSRRGENNPMKKDVNKLKISHALKGYKHSLQSRKNMSEAHKGKLRGGLTRTQKLEKIAGRSKPEYCEQCGGGGKICWDHSHATGKFRGWICHRCNVILGFSKDSPELLNKLVNYIKEHEDKTT